MSIRVASIAHIHDLDIEHAVTDLLQVASYLRLHLHVQSSAAIWVVMTLDSHSLLDFLALLASQEFILDLVTLSLISLRLEVIGGVILYELEVCLGGMLQPDVSITHILLIHDPGHVLVVEGVAGLGAPVDREDVLSFEVIVLLVDRVLHLLPDDACLGLLHLLSVFFGWCGTIFGLLLIVVISGFTLGLLLFFALVLAGCGSNGRLLVLSLSLVLLVSCELLFVQQDWLSMIIELD